MSISHFAFCWVLVIGSGLAQEAPEKAVRDMKDVQLGMSRDHVLASLGEKYDLTRIDDPQSQSALAGDEYWMASPKPNAVRNHDLDIDSGGAVRFWKGKASSIEMDLYASRQGESTRFAEQLFWLVYNRAELPVTPDKLCGVAVRVGLPKDQLLSELGKQCEVRPVPRQGLPALSDKTIQVGPNTSAWCVSADFACSHTIWFEGDKLSAVKPDRYYSESNPRSVMLPLRLQDRHDDKGERLRMNFTVGEQDFSIDITKRPGQPDYVTIQRIICCEVESPK